MAVTFRVASSAAYSTTSPVVTAPAGIQNNDLIIVAFPSGANHTVNSLIAGWTQAGSTVAQGSDSSTTVVYKIADNEGASWTFTDLFTGVTTGVYGVIVYSGVDTTTPLDVAVVQADMGNVPATPVGEDTATITPISDNCMIVSIFGADPSASTRNSTPGSAPVCTERLDDTQGGTNGWIYVQDHLQTTAIAEAHRLTPDEIEGAVYFLLALRPASAGGGRTALITRAKTLGVSAGMNFGVQY